MTRKDFRNGKAQAQDAIRTPPHSFPPLSCSLMRLGLPKVGAADPFRAGMRRHGMIGLILAGFLFQDSEADYDRNARRAAPRDAFPVLYNPKLVKAKEARSIRDDERVIGVFLGKEAKAYPISVMGRHELANDTCAGKPIAVSW